MPGGIKRLWSSGVAGHPASLRRQIELCNQVAIFGAVGTLPYQFFYAFHGLSGYLGVFSSNLVFISLYLVVLSLNHRGRYNFARNLLLTNAVVQVFVVTYFVGEGAGVHLFYFSLAAVLVFLIRNLRVWLYSFIMLGFGVLYTTAQFLFTEDRVPEPVPSPWIDILYAISVTGVMIMSGAFLYLFRKSIDQAEDDLKTSNQHLQTLSTTDSLTGLANRRALDATLDREWARLSRHPVPLSVMMCDVDHFKLFNDFHGHDGGDQCLKQIADVLRQSLSRPSDFVARYGGEEFALILPGTDAEGAKHIAEQLRRSVEELGLPHRGLGMSANVTISIGLSSADQFLSEGPDRLFKSADEALYLAKDQGRNRVVYVPLSKAVSSGKVGS